MKQKRVSPKETEKSTQELFEAIAEIKTAQEAQQFLCDLCTPAELRAMADRWQVVDLIKAEKPYRQIHEETAVSTTTIGRVARYLAMGAGGYELIYERLKQRKHDEKIQIKNRLTKKRPLAA
jgi:TrpR-related protein YerC/YecD